MSASCFCVYFFGISDTSEESSRQNLRESSQGILKPAGHFFLRDVFLFRDPDHAGTEKSSPFHAADPGIYRIHFCGCDGVYFSEGKTEQKKIGRNRADPCGDHCVFTVEKELYGLSGRNG